MRHGLLVSLILSICILAAAGCAPAPAVVYQGAPPAATGSTASSGGIIVSQQNLGLWVSGLGKATAAPDIVILTMGVESQQKTVAQAQKDAIDAMNNLMNVLRSFGVADKDIQTSQYNIQQVTRWDDKNDNYVIIGYRVSNIVNAKIRAIDKAGAIIDAAAVAGGDLIRINGINFSVDDPSPYYKIARERAVNYAMEKSKQMSQISGVKLGKLLYITESNSYIPPVRSNYMKFADSAAMAPSPTPISAGELEFEVTVELVYEIN
jgi:uncharacterized protein YggE